MKTKPDSYKSKTTGVILALICLTASSQAQLVIGGWQSSTSEGWINPVNGLSITDPSNTGEYSFAPGAVPGYTQSLQITQSGFANVLQLNLATIGGGVAAFENNHLLNFTFSAPSSAATGSTAGYLQIFSIAINAPGYGFNNQSWANATETGNTAFNQSGMPNYYYFAGSPFETQTVSLDYSGAVAAITAGGASYLQVTITANNGGGAPNYFWMNNVTLSGGPVPEPSTLALLGAGVAGLVAFRRRK
jgi:hypothetical protein